MIALARFARLVLVYNLAVIVWGGYVRASGSGAGCGSHWPLCNGEVIPWRPRTATLVEYSHRLSSGLVLLLVAGLCVWAWLATARGHRVRLGAGLALLFTLIEAAIGAGLVLFRLVARDESLARALWIAAHLLNTLLLLAALALTARWAGAAAPGGGRAAGRETPRGGAGGELRWSLLAALAGVMLIGATGAVAALGDTLFPAATLRQGLARDLSPAAHLLERLRVLHPFLALAVGALLLVLCERLTARRTRRAAIRTWAQRLRLLVLGQWALGAVNLGLLAPVWLQLAHLLVADLLWLALIVLTAEVFAAQPAAHEAAELVPARA
ncbi:MAG TPA: COX15/CtaA family protein [Thermoanaerobaculia bacterium]|nr:COX15/CtaA family protein [Thermoanaerobaculia bacterium]